MLRKRETQICIRTTEQERTRFQRNAKKCGLSLSEYLRKLANGYEPKPLPPIEYTELIRFLTDIYNELRITGKEEYAKFIVGVVSQMMAAVMPEKVGERDGDNEDMAGS